MENPIHLMSREEFEEHRIAFTCILLPEEY